MCGIFFSLSKHAHCLPAPSIKECLRRRGPDNAAEHKLLIQDGSEIGGVLYASLFSTVLSLRGQHIVDQPLIDGESGSFLCWNGEAWGISGDHLGCSSARFTHHYADRISGNDTKAVFELLLDASSCPTSSNEYTYYQPVLEAISLLSGPHAFVYFDAHRKCIFYARDGLGRRSLMSRTNANGDIAITSSSCRELRESQPEVEGQTNPNTDTAEWSEVDADGVYIIDLTKRAVNSQLQLEHNHEAAIRTWTWHEYNCVFIPYAPRRTPFTKANPIVVSMSISRLVKEAISSCLV